MIMEGQDNDQMSKMRPQGRAGTDGLLRHRRTLHLSDVRPRG